MQWYWLNDKQPDENGDYELRVDTDKGERQSSFKGKTTEEAFEKMTDAYVHLTLKLAGQPKPDRSVRQPLKQETKNITPEDRLRLSEQITDPEKVVEAVEEIVTARMGITPERVGSHLATMSKEEQDKFYAQESVAFRVNTPDFYPVPQNSDALFAYLKQQGWELTRNNLAIAYEMLREQGQLVSWPSDEERETERNFIAAQYNPPNSGRPNGAATAQQAPPPNTRPRQTSISTGLRNSDASATPPRPVKLAPKYTRADIERMGRAEYNDKLASEPGFRDLVNQM